MQSILKWEIGVPVGLLAMPLAEWRAANKKAGRSPAI